MSISAWSRNSAYCGECGQSFHSDYELEEHKADEHDLEEKKQAD